MVGGCITVHPQPEGAKLLQSLPGSSNVSSGNLTKPGGATAAPHTGNARQTKAAMSSFTGLSGFSALGLSGICALGSLSVQLPKVGGTTSLVDQGSLQHQLEPWHEMPTGKPLSSLVNQGSLQCQSSGQKHRPGSMVLKA